MNTVRAAALFVIALLIAGCSMTSRMEELVPPVSEVTVVNRHDANVWVEVIGGDDLTVSNGKFRRAVMQTIDATTVFASSQSFGDAQYELVIVILTLESSPFGGTVNISSNWILRTADGTEVWSDTVHGTGSSYDIGGVARFRASHERAAKDTIINGIEKLSQLSL